MSRGSCLSRFSEPESHPSSSWPALSPDLSSIEHLWDELGRRVRRPQSPRETLQELRDALVHEWNNTPQAFIVAARGGHTRNRTTQTSILHDHFCLSMICSDNDADIFY